jgi:hypothetical protein
MSGSQPEQTRQMVAWSAFSNRQIYNGAFKTKEAYAIVKISEEMTIETDAQIWAHEKMDEIVTKKLSDCGRVGANITTKYIVCSWHFSDDSYMAISDEEDKRRSIYIITGDMIK